MTSNEWNRKVKKKSNKAVSRNEKQWMNEQCMDNERMGKEWKRMKKMEKWKNGKKREYLIECFRLWHFQGINLTCVQIGEWDVLSQFLSNSCCDGRFPRSRLAAEQHCAFAATLHELDDYPRAFPCFGLADKTARRGIRREVFAQAESAHMRVAPCTGTVSRKRVWKSEWGKWNGKTEKGERREQKHGKFESNAYDEGPAKSLCQVTETSEIVMRVWKRDITNSTTK